MVENNSQDAQKMLSDLVWEEDIQKFLSRLPGLKIFLFVAPSWQKKGFGFRAYERVCGKDSGTAVFAQA